MMHVNLQRVIAIVLLLIAFVAVGASHAFQLLDDLPELVETAIVIVGVGCALVGVRLWFRKTPASDV
jgi:hypothetical protein